MESAQLLEKITNAVLLGIALVAIAIAAYLIRQEIRKGLAGLSERLSGDIKIFLESTESNVKPIIKEGFETAGNVLAVAFSETVSKTIVPLITSALDDARIHIKAAAD